MSLCNDIYNKIGEVEKLKEELADLQTQISEANSPEDLKKIKLRLKEKGSIMNKIKPIREELEGLKYNFPEEFIKMMNLKFKDEDEIKERIRLDVDGYIYELNLINKEISEIPPEFGNLTKLKSIYLGSNRIRSLPSEIGNLTNLTFLNISNNRIKSFPLEMGKLRNLTDLAIGYNELNSLPHEIGNLTDLTHLYLAHNKIINIPFEIGKLTNLTRLNFEGNILESLPIEIGKLTKLDILNLEKNPIAENEIAMKKIQNLLPKTIIITGKS